MSIEASVGQRGRNLRPDVITVKVLLNYAWARRMEFDLPLNAVCDSSTRARILFFQQRMIKLDRPDGQVRRNGVTLHRLRGFMPNDFDAAKLRAIVPRAPLEKVLLYCAPLLKTMELRSINTPLRRVHFLAQLAHESGSLLYREEIASGSAYEGRADLGNSQSGDGRRFKGRGLIQLTGRSNYRAYGDSIGTELTKDGAWNTVATDPWLAVDAAGWFWQTHRLNELADTDDVRKITRVVNGGTNGLADRIQFLKRAKWFMRVAEAA